jgi:TPR repeat protein
MCDFGDCLEYDKAIDQDLLQAVKYYHFSIKLNDDPHRTVLIFA